MLQNSREAEVYTLELQFLGRTNVYTEDAYGHFALIFSELPKYELPEKVFVLPFDGHNVEEEAFVSYLCVLSGEFTEKKSEESSGSYYIMEGTSGESETTREDLRVFTSFPAVISVEGSSGNVDIEVRDISVGGIMFVTDRQIPIGKTLSISFMAGRKEVHAKAVVKTHRPVHMQGKYGYGCKFSYMLPKIESEIRNFVFREDIAQHYRADE